ncbi:hypothetical protein [Streptomyces naphthomycinicus]|uniref:hypothetical protein n=1 Tax=Streptomyces naphthomycinicus TaxID=2872625 RepID=UPI001CED9845|nr:hypothetical protein [Streptomyces sp. TML10]
MTAVLLALAVAATGCQSDESGAGSPSAQRTEGKSCGELLDTQTKAAMRRLADVSASAKTEYSGHPQRVADQLATQYLTGKTDSRWSYFCGAYVGSSGLDSVKVQFSLTRELPPKESTTSDWKYYRLGKRTHIGRKAGFLYFDCSSAKFGGTTQLVSGEVRSSRDVTESLASAHEDNLRVLHNSGRALSALLKCRAGSGITGSFTMPPAV